MKNQKKISETPKANKNLETNSEKLGEQIGIQKKIQIQENFESNKNLENKSEN